MNKKYQDKSIYDIPLKGVDGERNILSKNKGKVTLITNVTGQCGNAPQFGIIEHLYQEYKNRGLEVVAVPTNDFCGPKITYGIYECGITDGKMAEDYARSEWNVTFPFSELLVSIPDREGANPEKTPHELYMQLNPDQEEAPMYGNFEKFVVDKYGRVALRLPNFVLLDFAYEGGLCDSPETELTRLKKRIEILLDEEYDENMIVPVERDWNYQEYLALAN